MIGRRHVSGRHCVTRGIHAGLNPELEGIDTADIVVVAAPVSIVPGILRAALPRLRARPSDCRCGEHESRYRGSRRSPGDWEPVRRLPSAGGGSPLWMEASRLGMFSGATVFLCPTPETGEDALGIARELWRMLGAQPEMADAAEHDRRLAWTSHLPQAVFHRARPRTRQGRNRAPGTGTWWARRDPPGRRLPRDVDGYRPG